jgi:predicted transcriptional regulator
MYYRKIIGGKDMSISIRVSDDELAAIRNYANGHDMNVSECIRKAILEKVEEEYDLEIFKKAKEEFEKDPKTYTLEEIEKELNL